MKLYDFTSAVVSLAVAPAINDLIDTRALQKRVAEAGRMLLQRIVQEVPEEHAVCEFDCPNRECTTTNCGACKLYQRLKIN